ncbi:MAG TPA: hypothetical protein VFM05_01920 [Candidatus Saccharimonadales bacterium]|nr:hypothetical protein [Candidatus Saccharimonadales bacterium]
MGEIRNPDHVKWAPWAWTFGGALGLLLFCGSIDGNEHGASKTNLDTMPSYAVEPMQTAEAAPSAAVPLAARNISAWVCAKIFVDRSRGEVIVRPVVGAPNSGRPLHLAGVTANGPEFEGPLPRDNFSIFNPDGREDNDQRITADECKLTKLGVRQVSGTTDPYVLVAPGSSIDNGDRIQAGPEGAVVGGLVHGHFEDLSDDRIDQFLNRLPVPAGR